MTKSNYNTNSAHTNKPGLKQNTRQQVINTTGNSQLTCNSKRTSNYLKNKTSPRNPFDSSTHVANDKNRSRRTKPQIQQNKTATVKARCVPVPVSNQSTTENEYGARWLLRRIMSESAGLL